MSKIHIIKTKAKTTDGQTLYGATIFLNNKQIKFVPFMTPKEKRDRYVAFLKENLIHEKVGDYDRLMYKTKSGKTNFEYWNNVPVPY